MVYEELYQASPDLYKEMLYRMSHGRNNLYSFDAVSKYWPQARDRILKDGGDAILSDLAARAKGDTLRTQSKGPAKSSVDVPSEIKTGTQPSAFLPQGTLNLGVPLQ